MTAKSRPFPLPLSSLEQKPVTRSARSSNDTAHRSANAAVSHVGLKVHTPQTATHNLRKHQPLTHVSSPTPVRASGGSQMSTQLRFQQNSSLASQSASLSSSQSASQPNSQPNFPHKSNSAPHAYSSPRRALVARLASQGISDSVVLSAIQTVPRHLFIEEGLVGQAYVDASLPIGYEQTISQPYIVARMIELMRNGKKLKSVLEIGTGCGYQAAVLAQLCENIFSIERIKPLHELAKKNLRSLRIANLRLHYGDGMQGLPQVAPFDGIILAAAGLQIPDDLLHQLAIGGRLIAPVGEKHQVLELIERTGPTDWTKTVLESCYFVPLRSGVI